MTTDNSGNVHRPAGTPDGGRFAGRLNAEDRIELNYMSQFGAGEFEELAADDVFIYSHANGDFDATEIGVDSIEISRDDDGTLRIEACTTIEFDDHLTRMGYPEFTQTPWVESHVDLINEAVAHSLPGFRLGDEIDWENQQVKLDLSTREEIEPGSFQEVLDIARQNENLKNYRDMSKLDGSNKNEPLLPRLIRTALADKNG